MPNVIFKTGTSAQYNALAVKNSNTLYWLTDTKEIRKGEELYGVGRLATSELAGLLSPEDKAKYDALVAAAESGISNLTSVDASVLIEKTEGGQTIRVGVSSKEENVLTVEDDGLFVPNTIIPEFSIEKQSIADNGYSVSYKLKRTYGDTVSYVGDTINIPKDLVLQNASMKTVSIVDVPYTGAQIGDPYLDLVFNDENNSHIYVPVKGLVDTYVAGNGIEIVDNTVSIKLDSINTNGLTVTESGLGLQLVTPTTAGAMSPADKIALDAIPATYATKDEVDALTIKKAYEVSNKPEGTLVDYSDSEIRVMCPADTKWELQNSGEGSDASVYYIGFRSYAPSEDVVSFKEDLNQTITDTTMYYFENNEFAGVDKYGRKYSIVWLPVAKYDETTSTWTYYGDSSTENKYIGWYYTVEWYNASGKIVAADTIRINLSNENCYGKIEPYYMNGFATVDSLKDVQDSVAEMEQSFVWGEM